MKVTIQMKYNMLDNKIITLEKSTWLSSMGLATNFETRRKTKWILLQIHFQKFQIIYVHWYAVNLAC